MKKFLPYLALGAIAVALYLSFNWAVGAAIHSRRVVMVPDLSSKSVGEALEIVSQQQLGLEKEGEQYDKLHPAGTIVHQTPPPGMMVREGRIIRVTLSQGGETLFVPNLIGQPMRNAQTALQNVGLSIGEVEHRPSLRYDKDQVMTTDPAGGAIIAKNGLVNLILSDGPPGADVLLTPDFVGRSLPTAQSWAAAHQITASIREEADISKPDGEVLMQSPTADSPIRLGDALTLVVNQSSGAATEQGSLVHYEVPQGSSDRDVRIVVIDETGEREVYRKAQAPGSKIDIHVQPKGHARARIFVNGVMAEEQPLQ